MSNKKQHCNRTPFLLHSLTSKEYLMDYKQHTEGGGGGGVLIHNISYYECGRLTGGVLKQRCYYTHYITQYEIQYDSHLNKE